MKELRTQALEYRTNAAGDASGLHCKDKSLALQSAAQETDINFIVKRMGVGHPPPMTARIPMQGEFGEVYDYQTALHLVMEAETAFMQLPAEARTRFNNDPGEFLSLVESAKTDTKAGDELVRLGLAVPRPPEAPKEKTVTEVAPK